MKSLAALAAASGILLVVAGSMADTREVRLQPTRPARPAPVNIPPLALIHAPVHRTSPDISPEALTEVVRRLCAACHNDQLRIGNLSLQTFDVAKAPESRETAEKMIAKLRAGMMPPPGIPRPAGDTMKALVETLEKLIDEAAATNPDPGPRTFQRLNRAEYERSIRELLGLEVNAGNWLPLDTKSANFDNIADVQMLSPTLLEAYLNAAAAVSRMAVGDPDAPSMLKSYAASVFSSQNPWD
ncbi:MAG: DUF1587 domain-containing protein, partial [Candidatus Rokuibacteriota bacterium]